MVSEPSGRRCVAKEALAVQAAGQVAQVGREGAQGIGQTDSGQGVGVARPVATVARPQRTGREHPERGALRERPGRLSLTRRQWAK